MDIPLRCPHTFGYIVHRNSTFTHLNTLILNSHATSQVSVSLVKFDIFNKCFLRCGLPLSFLLLQTGAVHEEFYKDCDLMLGEEVNVWGRRVLISDSDEFTKDYYRSKYGIGNYYCHVSNSFVSSFINVCICTKKQTWRNLIIHSLFLIVWQL